MELIYSSEGSRFCRASPSVRMRHVTTPARCCDDLERLTYAVNDLKASREAISCKVEFIGSATLTYLSLHKLV
jgi:hypothetical protein